MDDVRLWVWYWIDSNEVGWWRQDRGAAGDSARVFGCALGYYNRLRPGVSQVWQFLVVIE